jgi:DNA topoisomerase IA
MGMMPSDEIKKEEKFKVGDLGLTVIIQSGENGWTIMYADMSSEYEDIIDTVENNFNKAMEILKTKFSNIEQVNEIEFE